MTLRSSSPSGAPGTGVLHAWVDESMRLRVGEPGCYVLAAVVLDPAACEPARDALRALLLKGQRRLHWRDENAVRRQRIINCVAGSGICAVAVAGSPVERTKQERARRICMERLLYELHAMGVDRVFFEARTPSLNRRDAAMVAAIHGSGTISARLRAGTPAAAAGAAAVGGRRGGGGRREHSTRRRISPVWSTSAAGWRNAGRRWSGTRR
jgi:hypothetical protein